MKIVIDAGRGGEDYGLYINNVAEKNLMLALSKYMTKMLSNLGLVVSMTRDDDETLTNEARLNRILTNYGDFDDVYVISNQINPDEDVTEVIYALRDNNKLSNSIIDKLRCGNKKVYNAYQKASPVDPKKDYYYIQRNTKNMHPIIIKYGLIDMNEHKRNNINDDYQDYATNVVDGIIGYLGTLNNNVEEYTVKAGDTLWSIARKYSTTVDEIKSLNHLGGNLLKIGQKLKIKKPTETSKKIITHIVKPGDDLQKISAQYGVSLDSLKCYNKLSSNLLNVGSEILIPQISNRECECGKENEYIVKSGDNLYSIARQYGKTVEELMKYNNLTSNLLSINQVIKIPKENVITIYVVKSDDDLYNIAEIFNTTVNDIMAKNNLTNSNLSIGQILMI